MQDGAANYDVFLSYSRADSPAAEVLRARLKKGRQIADEIERVGLRLQLRKAQAEAGDIVLLYGDDSEALTHPYLARAWALRGADLRVPAPGQAKKVAMIGSLDHVTRQLIVHTSPTKRSSDFIAHLEQLDLTGTGNKTGRAGRGQRADPCQQAHS